LQDEDLLSGRPMLSCGVDCRNCDSYRRFLTRDESGVVNSENNYRCCWLPRDYPRGRDCPIRTCCEEKELQLCGECSEFEGCVIMREFYSKPGYDELRRRMLEEVARRR